MIVVVLGIAIVAMVIIIVATIVKRMTATDEVAQAPARVPVMAEPVTPPVPAEPWTAAISLGAGERIVDLRLDQGRVLVTIADTQGRMRARLLDAATGAPVGTIAAE